MFRRLLALIFLTPTLLYAQQTVSSLPTQPTQWSTELPRVSNMDIPFYPPLARAANVYGTVRLKVTTNGERVTDVQVLEGHKLLAGAAEHNVRSWKFLPSKPSTFSVLFTFKFADANANNYEQLIKMLPDAEVRTELPLAVEITSAPRPTSSPL